MKEQLVLFDTAKLAKEKGFNIPSHSYYFEDSEFKEFEINDTYGYYGDEYTVDREEFYNNWNDNWKTTKEGNRCLGCDKNPRYLKTFSAPTQSLLQKWLREKHKIHVEIDAYGLGDNNKWLCNIVYCYDPKEQIKLEIDDLNHTCSEFDTYEEALEVGLQEALKLIKELK